MQLDGIANELENFSASLASCDTSRKVWNVCAVTCPALLNHNEVFHNSYLSHFLRPALLRMLLSVPGGMSMPSFPATVTVPGLSGCSNCLWLPLVRTWRQPSSCNSRITSRTFMCQR